MRIFPEPKKEWDLFSMLSNPHWKRAKEEDVTVSALVPCYMFENVIFLGDGASR